VVSCTVCLCSWQELENARAIIAARLASKDSNGANAASAANSSGVTAMSLIAQGYDTESEEEGEIEYGKARHVAKKAKLQTVAKAVEDMGHLSAISSVPQAVADQGEDVTCMRLTEQPTADSHSEEHRTTKTEPRSSDDHKSHRRKDSSTDRHDRSRHESSKTSRDQQEAKHKGSSSGRPDRDNHSRLSEEKASSSQGETDQLVSHRSREHDATKELSEKSDTEQHVSRKDSKVDGHRRHSSRAQETSGRHEVERTSESEKRRFDRRRSRSITRRSSPDARHQSSHSADKKTDR